MSLCKLHVVALAIDIRGLENCVAPTSDRCKGS